MQIVAQHRILDAERLSSMDANASFAVDGDHAPGLPAPLTAEATGS